MTYPTLQHFADAVAEHFAAQDWKPADECRYAAPCPLGIALPKDIAETLDGIPHPGWNYVHKQRVDGNKTPQSYIGRWAKKPRNVERLKSLQCTHDDAVDRKLTDWLEDFVDWCVRSHLAIPAAAQAAHH